MDNKDSGDVSEDTTSRNLSNPEKEVSTSVRSCMSALSKRSSCMTFRTLDESLHGKERHTDSARLRRSYREFSSCHGRVESAELSGSLSVSFSNVEIREYPVILGNSPAVSNGPPLSIDWMFHPHPCLNLEEYETDRPPRRSYLQMAIPSRIRQTMLQTSGHSKREIQKQIKEANIHRSKRRHTVSMLHQKQLHEMVEKTKRSIRNFMTKKKVREIRFIESSMDIAKRKQAEADILAENEASSYEAVANEMNDSIFALKLEGNEINDSNNEESSHVLVEKSESSMNIAKRKQAEADILAENEAFSYEAAANEIGDSSIFALNLEGNEVNDSNIKESSHVLGEKSILITEDEDS